MCYGVAESSFAVSESQTTATLASIARRSAVFSFILLFGQRSRANAYRWGRCLSIFFTYMNIVTRLENSFAYGFYLPHMGQQERIKRWRIFVNEYFIILRRLHCTPISMIYDNLHERLNKIFPLLLSRMVRIWIFPKQKLEYWFFFSPYHHSCCYYYYYHYQCHNQY